MATSGSSNFAATRNDIIRKAARLCGALRAGSTLGEQAIADWAFSLNAMVKRWQADGIHVWTVADGTLFPVASQESYGLANSSSGAYATQSYVQTALSADEASGQTVLSVDSITGIAASDYIVVQLDDGTLHQSTVSGTPSAGTVTIADALASAASEGSAVFAFTNKIERPLKIVDARLHEIASGTETPISVVSRLSYYGLPNKSEDGEIVQVFYDPQLATGRLHLYQPPSSVAELVKFTWWRPIEDFDAGGDNPDLPAEWISTLYWNLAQEMGPEYSLPDATWNRIVFMAEKTLDSVSGFDREAESIEFGPDMDC